MPCSFHIFTYLPGFPAPVVTTDGFSSAMICAISSTSGFIIMRFTPKGLSVRDFAVSISFRIISPFMAPVPMIPSAPALDTAAAKAPVAT